MSSPRSRFPVQRLPGTLVDFLWTCGLHPGPLIIPENISAMLGVTVSEAEFALEDLRDSNLLIGRGQDSYTMHDLLKGYSRSRSIEIYSLEQQYAQYRALCNRYQKRLADGDNQWLFQERSNIVALCQAAEMQEAAALALEVTALLIDLGFYTESGTLARSALKWYDASQDDRGRARALWLVGNVNRLTGDYDEAHGRFLGSLELYGQIDDVDGELSALWGLAEVAYLTGDYQTALRRYKEMRTRHKEFDNRLGVAQAEWAIATVLAYSEGAFSEANAGYSAALQLYQDIQDSRGIAMSFWGLADVARMQGSTATAREYYEASISIQRTLGNRREEADSLWGLASISCTEGDLDAAESLFIAALDIQKEISNIRGRGNAICGLGEVARLRGETDASRQLLQDSLAIHVSIGNKKGQAVALVALGKLAVASDSLDAAAELYDQLKPLMPSIGRPIRDQVQDTFSSCAEL